MPRVLISEPTPPAVAALLEQRRRAGADRHDEMWDGVLHMAPAPRDVHALIAAQLMVSLAPLARDAGLVCSAEFSLGTPDDYRVPDLGLHRERAWGTWAPSVALAVEILSPKDETLDKLPFYAAHGVDEVLIVDPDDRTVRWLARASESGYREVSGSELISLGGDELAQRLWP